MNLRNPIVVAVLEVAAVTFAYLLAYRIRFRPELSNFVSELAHVLLGILSFVFVVLGVYAAVILARSTSPAMFHIRQRIGNNLEPVLWMLPLFPVFSGVCMLLHVSTSNRVGSLWLLVLAIVFLVSGIVYQALVAYLTLKSSKIDVFIQEQEGARIAREATLKKMGGRHVR